MRWLFGLPGCRGARTLLLAPAKRAQRIAGIISMTTHVELAADPQFQDIYAENMALRPYNLR